MALSEIFFMDGCENTYSCIFGQLKMNIYPKFFETWELPEIYHGVF